MRRIILQLAAAFAVGAAVASPVTVDQAAKAARNWAVRGGTLGAAIGKTVEKTTSVSVTNDVSYYLVKMASRGTVVLSSDTESEPVVAFIATTNDCSGAAGESTLKALLERDAIVRANIRAATATASSRTGLMAVKPLSAAEKEWAALLGSSGTSFASVDPDPGEDPVTNVDTVCVSPMVKTKWDQTTAGGAGRYCYNWYCNYYGKPKYPCGCTATAMAQIMRYHKFPTAEIESKAFIVVWGDSYYRMYTVGGTYPWDLMVEEPSADNYTAERWMAIGRLCWDCGVSIGSIYASGDTSAFICDVPTSLKDYFGYANATAYFSIDAVSQALNGEGTHAGYVTNSVGLHLSEVRQKVILSNLEAGLPVQLGIYGYTKGHVGDKRYWGGHSIVADGYGYVTTGGETVEYVHLNLGWSGYYDAWYNLPEVKGNISTTVSGSPYDFTVLGGAAYNVSPTETGSVASGRCTFGGAGVPNRRVDIFRADDTTTACKTTYTDSSGCWHYFGTAGNYVAKIDDEGRSSGLEIPFVLSNCTYDAATYESQVGNSWCARAALAAEARIGTTEYATLGDALAAAVAGDTVTILKSTRLYGDVTLDRSITIECDAADTTSSVYRRDHARIAVSGGARVTFKNVWLEEDSESPVSVTVEAGSAIAVSGRVGLGTVETADAQGFVLAAPISAIGSGLSLRCATASGAGESFGRYECSETEAAGCAAFILDDANLDLGGRAGEAGELVWGVVSVDPVQALAYDPSQNTYYRSLDKLFKYCTGDARIVIMKDAGTNAFQAVTKISSRIELVCTNATHAVISPAPTAGFLVQAGGSLIVSNITFSGFTGRNAEKSVLVFAEGAGSAVDLRAGTTFQDCTGYYKTYGGTIVARKGTHVTVHPGVTFRNCRAVGGNASGGAIFLSAGCTLDLQGGTFENCRATTEGGAVYAAGGAPTVVRVSGDLACYGNFGKAVDDNASKYRSDLYFADAACDFSVAGTLTAEVGCVGVRFTGDDETSLNTVGKTFVKLADASYAASAGVFRNDTDTTLGATVTEDGVGLRWTEVASADGQCDATAAVARVVYDASPSSTNYYAAVDTAFDHLIGDATVLVGDGTRTNAYHGGFEVSHRVVLKPYGEEETLVRNINSTISIGGSSSSGDSGDAITVVAGGSLVISNVTFRGATGTVSATAAFRVDGGELTFGPGTSVEKMVGNGSRACGAVVVWNGGTFTMEEGSQIKSCANTYVSGNFVSEGHYEMRKAANDGLGGGLLVENATARLKGGLINGCYTAGIVTNAAGVFVGNDGAVYVSGDIRIFGNGTPMRDLVVADTGSLYLDGALASEADVRVRYDVKADTNLAARVSWKGWTLADLKASAARIRRGEDEGNPRASGVVVTNGGDAVIAWSDSGKTSYTDSSGRKFALTSVPAGYRLSSSPAPLVGGSLELKGAAVVQQGLDPVSQAEEDGTVTLSFGAGTAGCWYYLYSAASLAADETWTLVAEKRIERDGDDVAFTDERGTGDSKFWKVVAERGLVQE